MNDLISRQAAIKAIQQYGVGWLDETDDITPEDSERFVIKLLEDIPAVHPELNEWCADCKEYDQEAHCCHRFSNVIRETVEEMKDNRWIPVSERLPEPEGHKEYLVTLAHYDPNYHARIVEVEEYEARDWETAPHWATKWGDGIGVIAWQPLPAPYRPEE